MKELQDDKCIFKGWMGNDIKSRLTIWENAIFFRKQYTKALNFPHIQHPGLILPVWKHLLKPETPVGSGNHKIKEPPPPPRGRLHSSDVLIAEMSQCQFITEEIKGINTLKKRRASAVSITDPGGTTFIFPILYNPSFPGEKILPFRMLFRLKFPKETLRKGD